MLLDRFLPRYDVSSRHQIEVDASPEEAFRAAVDLDLSGSVLVKVLFGLRSLPRLVTRKGGLPTESVTLETFEKAGFVELGRRPNEEIVLGVVGQFWKPTGGIRSVEPELFTQFDEPGYAKGAFNFRVRPRPSGSLITTETRVLCTDAAARRKFKLYWTAIGPFSGLIRGEMLRTLKRSAERLAQASAGSS